MKDIEPLLSDQLEILQAGALNNLSMEQIKELAPDEGDTVLVSALQSGASSRDGGRKNLRKTSGVYHKSGR